MPRVLAASSTDSSFPPGTIAGVIFAALLGAVLLIALVMYLSKRYARHKFTRVANPAHDDDMEGTDLPRTSSRRSKLLAHHLQRPSISSEPLIPPDAWPSFASTSRVVSPDMPPCVDSGHANSRQSSLDLGEIGHGAALGSLSRVTIPAQQPSPASSRQDLSTSPHTRQTTGNGAPPSPCPSTPSKTMFLHRTLKSRAQASESASLAERPSFDLSQSRSIDPSDVHAEIERLLAEAERAVRDAEIAQKGMAEEEMVGVEEGESAKSIYSQGTTPVDDYGLFTEPSPASSFTRRRQRITTELPPVAEIPDSTKVPGVLRVSSPVSTVANSSLDAQASHGTVSRAMFMAVDQFGSPLPLLTSTNFGKESTSGASSSAGLGSSLSGRTSRYPSLVTSDSSRSGQHSDDWHHPPSGLAGLTTLTNPHSPVKEHPAVLVPAKRAHLRAGTASSIPAVEKRDVMQGVIASIDVVL